MSDLFVRGDLVTPETPSWLWEPWVPLGSLTIVEGPPGGGKSTLVRHLAAAVTRGTAPYPAGSTREPASVLWITSEESASVDLVPAMIASETDLTKIYVSDAGAEAADTSIVARLAREVGATLVVLDNLVALVGVPEPETYQGVQRRLGPWVRLADEVGLAVVGIRHWRKSGGDAISAGIGSIAWSGIARSVVAIRDSHGERTMAASKSSRAATHGSLRFTIDDQRRLQWLGESTADADDLTACDPSADDDVRHAWDAGHRTIRAIADESGVPRSTVQRTLRRLGLR